MERAPVVCTGSLLHFRPKPELLRDPRSSSPIAADASPITLPARSTGVAHAEQAR